jgi:stage II sporulation protein R
MYKKLIIYLMTAVLAVSITYSGMSQALERSDLIRLHVIANSDSPEDQALKLRVRDHLLSAFGEIFQDARNISQAKALIKESLDNLELEAQAEIQRQGYNYPVKAQLGIFPFPTKAYGDMVYPAGRYEALRVVIGQGTGANWWCVMFPPLCFVDVSSGVARRPLENTEGQNTKKTSVSNPDKQEETTVVYTFKLAEWWQSIKAWLGRIV